MPPKDESKEVRQAAVAPLPAPTFDVEKRLRAEWWLGHGCSFHGLYGDDGEMQCNEPTCRKDFKRDPLDDLRRHVEQRRVAIALRLICKLCGCTRWWNSEASRREKAPHGWHLRGHL
jgi:hypothetical protein